MTELHPAEELRGQVNGFPRWAPVARVAADLDAPVLDAAVEWLTGQLQWFDQRQWERFLPRREFPEGTVLELLVLCRILRRGRFRDHELVGGAIELAQAVVSEQAFHSALGRADEKFPYRAYLVALLAELGCPVRSAVERVQVVLETGCGGWTGAWQPALTRLELRYVLDLGGFASTSLPVADLTAATIAAAAPDPLYLRDDEAYALTHVVFYATDFGARPMPAGAALIETMRTLLGMYLALGDMDLAGELLLCLQAVGAADCPMTAHGWRELARRRRTDGAVPGPLYEPDRWSGLRGEVREAYAFGTCHHTTMVAAMAAAVREDRNVC
ncbi:DUF6895 family protein [Nocardia altamirensis]|uniref:DUF6895 family protein n=1 Tax=Nocardia altamirensis TaxID=472158 RepID=UPI000A035E8A|nr:hypothetical protein [Nocardia altamirensis]